MKIRIVNGTRTSCHYYVNKLRYSHLLKKKKKQYLSNTNKEES